MGDAASQSEGGEGQPASTLVHSRTHGVVCFAVTTLDYSPRSSRRYRHSLPTPFGVERPHPGRDTDYAKNTLGVPGTIRLPLVRWRWG